MAALRYGGIQSRSVHDPANTAERIEMPFEWRNRVGPNKKPCNDSICGDAGCPLLQLL